MKNIVPVLLALFTAAPAAAEPIVWRPIQAGVELASIDVPTKLVVVRVDPSRARLVFALASMHDKRPRTAAAWCEQEGLSVAINAGMFKDDGVANVGHLAAGPHLNNPAWVSAYRSALAFDPKSGEGAATMVDLDDADARGQLERYRSVVQNLRLIRRAEGKGRAVWSEQPRRWSEAAVAFDDHARVLFLFSRAPYSMAAFDRIVLGLPLGVVRAMHVEGGPEASLSIHGGGIDADYFGSYETGFVENDGNDHAWPIPNVLGVAR